MNKLIKLVCSTLTLGTLLIASPGYAANVPTCSTPASPDGGSVTQCSKAGPNACGNYYAVVNDEGTNYKDAYYYCEGTATPCTMSKTQCIPPAP
jgi:hypothetical protein